MDYSLNCSKGVIMGNRIEVCGAIAAGKTTLANAFEQMDYHVLLEDFTKIAVLDDFYSDPTRFAFETEILFTLQHYYQVKKMQGIGNPIICDFSSIDDYAFALVTLNEKEMYIYNQIFSYIQEWIGKPKKLIKLSTSTEELVNRIHNRGRKNEMGIDGTYLKIFEKSLEEAIIRYYCDVPIVNLNTEIVSISEYDDVFLERLLI